MLSSASRAASLHIEGSSDIGCCFSHGPPGGGAYRCSEAAACACCRLQARQGPQCVGSRCGSADQEEVSWQANWRQEGWAG